ncbi:TVP38/TMEM64 family protein [filamentous cyanobacterium CCT1]|nr:TVP38/TMEM64 family protein [filamentous cyanobacterium CCT1]PSN81106.1 TVP38/TMEM64 family protein [filamentous cyanobacterium CCP4]
MIRLLISLCLLATAIGIYLVGAIQPEQLELMLQEAGVWAPIAYMATYVAATVLILPSTPLNLAGGAIFGPWLGTLWTSIAAVVAAVIAFIFTRTIGRDIVSKRIAGRWQALDAEIQIGGSFYMFAVRLQPVIPYGLVNIVAALTSIRFKDFLIGTALGTVPGIFPFVLLGSFGLKAIKTGEFLPLLFALSLLTLLVISSVWYYRRRTLPHKVFSNSDTRK